MRAGLAAVVLTFTVQSAWAQRVMEPETGSNVGVPRRARIPTHPGTGKAERGRIVMADFARCAIDRGYRKVDRAVSQPPGPEFFKAVAMLATTECLDSGEIRFQPIVMRGPLFKELYIRRMAAQRSGRNWYSMAPKINFALPRTAMDDGQRQHMALMTFGACVVAKNPDLAREIVLQPSASAAQDSAISTIMPSLSGCLMQGTTLRMGKQVVEGALAEVLYRDVDAATPFATAESK